MKCVNTWTSLEPPNVAVDPGSTATATLRLRNDGDVVEYQLSLVGAPAAWGTVEPATLRLYPQAQDTVRVTLAPPRSPQVTAGVTAYGVQIRPRQNPQLFDVAEGRVTVGEFRAIHAEMFPITVRGRFSRTPVVSVDNLGNAPLVADLRARDDEDALTFVPTPPTLTLPPGATSDVRLRIRPRRLRLVAAAERHPFGVTVIRAGMGFVGGANDGENRAELRGTFVHRPLMSRLALVLTVLVALGALVAAAVWTMPRLINAARNLGTTQTSPPATQPPTGSSQTGAGSGNRQTTGDGGQNTAVAIVSRQDGNYLTVQDGGQTDGTAVVVGGRTSQRLAANQFWAIVDLGGGLSALVPGNATGTVLARTNDNPNLAVIRMVPNAGQGLRANRLSKDEQWTVQAKGGGQFAIVNVADNACLTSNGANQQAQVQRCDDRFASLQRWSFSTS
jgi:hypothetical protein